MPHKHCTCFFKWLESESCTAICFNSTSLLSIWPYSRNALHFTLKLRSHTIPCCTPYLHTTNSSVIRMTNSAFQDPGGLSACTVIQQPLGNYDDDDVTDGSSEKETEHEVGHILLSIYTA